MTAEEEKTAGPLASERDERAEDGEDMTVHLRLDAEDGQRLRTILGFMLADPEAKKKRERVSYAGAIRYAMRQCVERPPAHVKQEGR